MIFTLFGESHGEVIGMTLTGVPDGLEIDEIFVGTELKRRATTADGARREPDDFKFISGTYKGLTTGAPLTVLIGNVDARPQDYESLAAIPRPSHADFSAFVRYRGHADMRGGGHFSGRLTAPMVIAGAIAKIALAGRGIGIRGHILSVGGIRDASYRDVQPAVGQNPTIDKDVYPKMLELIRETAEKQDSVGGEIECVALGLSAGHGDPWLDSAESILSKYLFAVPAVKCVGFGAGYSFASMNGSRANDAFYVAYDADTYDIQTKTNNNGGICGGITNGAPVIVTCTIKPSPSIGIEQDSVNLTTMQNTKIAITGRHDACIVPRAVVVCEAALALGICELLGI